MNERQKIEEALRKKENEIQGLEERLKTAKVYVKALQDVLKAIQSDDEGESTESSLRQGSSVADAREALLQHHKPMHISELLKAIGKPVTREARASLASSLAAYVRREEIFVRTAPNTFGLIELDHGEEEDSNPEPPSGFGQLEQTAKEEDEEIPF